ncbi:amino acid ABC transporter permease [Lachnoclostridium sp. An14]|uniref:amino acid ABC transporter permease n=1 Tax=Lachnoclostridium sp. An14 TaxID=1965562 RepID=UPI000B37A5B2|nr:amino acid ABC transporter permease [Lachnoclostridium sp. An14]
MQIADILAKNFPVLLAALGETLKLTVVSLFFATIIGVIFGLLKVSGKKPLKILADIYIDIIRGTPLMVQTMIIYYGIGQMLRPMGFMWANYGGSFAAAAVTLSLNAGAYMAEIIRGGIESVDKGQMEAARSLGMSYAKSMQKIILPQAFRTMLPSIINQFIISLKDTSLVSVIGVSELTKRGNILTANAAARSMAIWVTIALFYLVICTILSRVAKIMERRVSYGK